VTPADEAAPAAEPTPRVEAPKPPRPARPGRLRRAGAWIRDHYLVADPRTLGLFRLFLGFLVVGDCVRHWKEARWFYSNAGVLTNHYHLFRPSSGYNFSIYHAFSSLEEVHVAFALSFIAYFCFFIGWHTRVFSIATFLLVTSMDNRLVMVENGGYVVVNLVCCWAMFMPLGRRFSVDALIRSYRERKEKTAADLNDRTRPASEHQPFVSGIVLLALLNLATIYFFNVINKSGAIWKRGETVHYVLHLDRMVTGIAVFAREHLPFWSTKPLTWGVLVLEALLVPWILSPFGRRWTRPLAVVGIWILNGSFGIMMRLGPFSWFLLGWATSLFLDVHWQIAERWYRRRVEPRVVVYDGSSALAFAVCRLLKRLDNLELLQFEEASPSAVPAEPGYREGATARARPPLMEVRDLDGRRSWRGRDALSEIVQALPGGRVVRPLLPVLTLGLAGPALRAISARRDQVSRFFGLTLPPRGLAHPHAPSPLRRKVAWVGRALRETLVLYLGLIAVSQALRENKSLPQVVRNHKQPKFVEGTIVYFRIFQGWGMFAPNPITDDGVLAIDAYTIDGRRIDPFTGKEPDLDLTDARGLGLNQIWQDYFNRIRFDRNKGFRQPLREYLQRWHEETGRPEDELVAFDVYWVRDQCPRPGMRKAYKNETIAILTWRKPGYRRPPELPAIPPEPKVESAGN
jgi:predicted DCC family thiol-disulfide oxidoreductase YuxK